MTSHSGGCLCGQVTYSVAGPLRDVIACHCNQCRKTSGHFVAATSAATSDLTVRGQVTWFRSSDTAQRGFCATCGSNLFWQPDAQERCSIFTGTLDGQTGLHIAKQLHAEDKGDYYDLPNVPII